MMKTRATLVLSALLASLAWSSFSGVFAAKYLRPDDSKELFKLEKIPLQVDSMKELSRHLTSLAKREQDDSAVHRRGTGQLLALAMRLDPANQEARETNRALLRNAAVETTPNDKILKAKARLRFYQRWLASPDAGGDANALAKYITDATRVLMPETLDNADSADWSGVLPPLAHYERTDKKGGMPKPKRTDDAAPGTTPTPKEKQSEAQSPGYRIAKLSVRMPLALEKATKYRDPKNNFQERIRYSTHYTTCPVRISISPHPEGVRLQMVSKLGRGNGREDKGGLGWGLAAFQKHLGSSSAGKGARITIEIASPQAYSSQNGSAALAAVQLMLHASRANKKLRDDIYLCAALDSSGKLRLPVNFWRMLEALRKDNGKKGRLIVPKAAAAPLTQLLVYGEPDFFTRWEVFTVGNMDQALAVAAKSATPEMAQATELYMPVRKLAGKNAVTKLAVNRAVRKRLDQVVKLAPNHLSASVLLLQGSGHRPMRLNRVGLAFHLLPVIKNMKKGLATCARSDRPSASLLKKLHEQSREELDPIERLVSRTEGELYEEAMKITNDMRSLNLLVRRNERDVESGDSARQKARTAVFALQARATALEEKAQRIIDAAGE